MMRAILLAMVLGACSAEPHLVLEIDARPAVRPVASLRVTMRDGAGSEKTAEIPLDDARFPATLVIATDGRDGPFEATVEAIGTDGASVADAIAASASGRIVAVLEPRDFAINELVAGEQALAPHGAGAIAVADDGGFFVTWTDEGRAMGRLFTPDTMPLVNRLRFTDLEFELPVDVSAGAATIQPAVGHGPAGYITAWSELPPFGAVGSVATRTFDPRDGEPGAMAIIATGGTDGQPRPQLPAILASAGGFAVAYHATASGDEEPEALGTPMIAHRGPDGSQSGPHPLGGPPCPCPVAAQRPRLAALDDTRAVAVWIDDDVASGFIHGRFIALADGQPTGEVISLTEEGDTDIWEAWVVATGDGGFAVAWLADPIGAAAAHFELQRYDGDGRPRGTKLRLASHHAIDPAPIALATLPTGHLAAVWLELGAGDDPAATGTVMLRLLHPDGMPIGEARTVSSGAPGTQRDPSIAARPDGSLVIAWTDTSGRAPDVDRAGVRARVIYPELEPVGAIGGPCGDDGCEAPLSCVAETGLCHPSCSVPEGSACDAGGKCIEGVCLFD